MKELVIISGKGGTGKTSITAAFAGLAKNPVLCDADVDAANLHLLLDPTIQQRSDFTGGSLAKILPDRCTECGTCRDLCRFGAIDESFTIDAIDCEGCGVCVDLCPEQAIAFPTKINGQWFISDTRFGPLVHARLNIAEENSGRLVALVRKEARKLASDNNLDLIITDGPPGIGCPVIASIGEATAIIIIAEPTVSGIHDMNRVMELAAHFKVPGMVCVNKFDLNTEQTKAIEAMTRENNMAWLGQIPFHAGFTQLMIKGKTIMETDQFSEIRHIIGDIWDKILKNLKTNNSRHKI